MSTLTTEMEIAKAQNVTVAEDSITFDLVDGRTISSLFYSVQHNYLELGQGCRGGSRTAPTRDSPQPLIRRIRYKEE